MSNRLIDETSQYLLQHAENPVDWFPWGEEALDRAREQHKPVFLSVGYSACHWCHVMAHESFEDERIAAILNGHFVSIKVDREERPDIDRVYMAAVQALTGRGGWPMSVFLTPEGTPFYGGTYFPPTARYGMPSFHDVLRSVIDAWETREDELGAGSAELLRAMQQRMETSADGSVAEDSRVLSDALSNLKASFDAEHGGWGAGPKFPQPMVLEFLLRTHQRSGQQRALGLVTQTLEAMARGGMYDQLGGGFHRYSVDERWLVPHFEKMLYDNAQLALVYLHAWQVTGVPFFRTIAEETLDYVRREMLAPGGGYYATQDADSEGEEGKYYVWTEEEIRDLLGGEADAFVVAYGVTRHGNFEGKNILELRGSTKDRETLKDARRRLLERRDLRTHPGRDEKVVVSWNGLMMAAFAEAARVLGRLDYRKIAERNASFLLGELRTSEGRLFHTWKVAGGSAGGQAKVPGFLQDYTHVIEGLLELYQTSFEPCWYGGRGRVGGDCDHPLSSGRCAVGA